MMKLQAIRDKMQSVLQKGAVFRNQAANRESHATSQVLDFYSQAYREVRDAIGCQDPVLFNSEGGMSEIPAKLYQLFLKADSGLQEADHRAEQITTTVEQCFRESIKIINAMCSGMGGGGLAFDYDAQLNQAIEGLSSGSERSTFVRFLRPTRLQQVYSKPVEFIPNLVSSAPSPYQNVVIYGSARSGCEIRELSRMEEMSRACSQAPGNDLAERRLEAWGGYGDDDPLTSVTMSLTSVFFGSSLGKIYTHEYRYEHFNTGFPRGWCSDLV